VSFGIMPAGRSIAVAQAGHAQGRKSVALDHHPGIDPG
jgi:hypothetical protein